MTALPASFYARDTLEVLRELIGKVLVHTRRRPPRVRCHRRGRGLHWRNGSSLPRGAGSDSTQCAALWAARPCVRVSQLRASSPGQRRHRAGRGACGNPHSRARAARGDRPDAAASRSARSIRLRRRGRGSSSLPRARQPDRRARDQSPTQHGRPDGRAASHRGSRWDRAAACLVAADWPPRRNDAAVALSLGRPSERLRPQASPARAAFGISGRLARDDLDVEAHRASAPQHVELRLGADRRARSRAGPIGTGR